MATTHTHTPPYLHKLCAGRMWTTTSLRHGCVIWCKVELNVFGYTGCSALRLHISVVSLIHLSHLVGLFPPERLHTTLKPIVVCKCGLHKSHPCARIHTSSQAHSERTHTHTHTPRQCSLSSYLRAPSLIYPVCHGNMVWPTGGERIAEHDGKREARERIWAEINSGLKSYGGEVSSNYSRAWGVWLLCVTDYSGQPASMLSLYDLLFYNHPSVTTVISYQLCCHS